MGLDGATQMVSRAMWETGCDKRVSARCRRAIQLHVLYDRSLSLAQLWDGGDGCFLPFHGRQTADGVDNGEGCIASIVVGGLVSMVFSQNVAALEVGSHATFLLH